MAAFDEARNVTEGPEVEVTLLRRLGLVEKHVALENTHDVERVLETFGEDPLFEDAPWGESHRGRDGVRHHYEELFRAAPDLGVTIHRRHVAEEVVVLECTIHGTHLGTWRGLPATGRSFEFQLCAVYTFDDEEKLAGERIFYDRAAILHQLGVFHDPESLAGRLTTALAHPVTIARAVARRIRAN